MKNSSGIEKKTTASVIIPVTRGTQTLYRCLESLQNAHIAPLEIVLVGDISEIKLPERLNVTLVYESIKSSSIRRNRGVEQSCGDVLCFIDDDVQVTPHWLGNSMEILDKHPSYIIGGPNRDMRRNFCFRLPSVVQASPLTEGLVSHRKLHAEKREVGIHDMPLCNMIMTRSTFELVGGFNENVTHYLDDVEFNYIATSLGCKLMLYQELEVQHDIRPAFIPYLKYKLRSRFEIGRVFPLYYCLYLDAMQIKSVLLSYIMLPLLVTLGEVRVLLVFALMYFVGIIVASSKHIKDVAVFSMLPFFIFLTHVVSYIGFTLGVMVALLKYKKLHELLPQRDKRFRNGK